MESSYDYLRNTLNNIGPSGPSDSPILNYPELRAAYAPAYTSQQYDLVGKATGQEASALADYQRQTEAKARQAKLSELEKKKAEIENREPQKMLNDVGGWDYFDKDGNKISAYQFAQLTGKSLPSVLEGSLDPKDIEFQNDYSTIKDIYDAVGKGDTKKISQYLADNPQLKGKMPDDLLSDLFDVYPEIYQPPTGWQKFLEGAGGLMDKVVPGDQSNLWKAPANIDAMEMRGEADPNKPSNYYNWLRSAGR